MFEDGQRRVTASLNALSDPHGSADHLQPARTTAWGGYAKPPVASPHQGLDDVGRYTHRVASANHRLLDLDDGHVRFRDKDYRADSPQPSRTMTRAATEVIRRVLLPVLPAGFHRIRDYGWLGNRHRMETRARCRQLLGTTSAQPIAGETVPPPAHRDRAASLTGVSLRPCPVCPDGHLVVTECLRRTPSYPPRTDTACPTRAHCARC